MMSHHDRTVKRHYLTVVAEMSLPPCKAQCPGWASSSWRWAGASSSPGCIEMVDGGRRAAGDHLSLSSRGREEAGAGSLHLSESRPGTCACSRAAAWCRAQTARRKRRTPRGAGSNRRCSAAPSVMRRLCPRCRQPSLDPECHPWNRQSRKVMINTV